MGSRSGRVWGRGSGVWEPAKHEGRPGIPVGLLLLIGIVAGYGPLEGVAGEGLPPTVAFFFLWWAGLGVLVVAAPVEGSAAAAW